MLKQEKVMTIKDWLKVWIIMMIPILNIIMWIKWVVSDKTNYNLKNFLISSLIVPVIVLILMIFCGSIIGATMMEMYN